VPSGFAVASAVGVGIGVGFAVLLRLRKLRSPNGVKLIAMINAPTM